MDVVQLQDDLFSLDNEYVTIRQSFEKGIEFEWKDETMKAWLLKYSPICPTLEDVMLRILMSQGTKVPVFNFFMVLEYLEYKAVASNRTKKAAFYNTKRKYGVDLCELLHRPTSTGRDCDVLCVDIVELKQFIESNEEFMEACKAERLQKLYMYADRMAFLQNSYWNYV